MNHDIACFLPCFSGIRAEVNVARAPIIWPEESSVRDHNINTQQEVLKSITAVTVEQGMNPFKRAYSFLFLPYCAWSRAEVEAAVSQGYGGWPRSCRILHITPTGRPFICERTKGRLFWWFGWESEKNYIYSICILQCDISKVMYRTLQHVWYWICLVRTVIVQYLLPAIVYILGP